MGGNNNLADELENKKMKTSIITITPHIASHLLKYNFGNRSLRKRTVQYFIDCLKEGSFHTTHQGIAIQGTMRNPIRVLDGQHRLEGIAQSGISAEVQVTEDASLACFENADNGLPRSMSDRASIKGKEASICGVFFELCAHGSLRHKPSVDRIKAIYDLIEEYLKHIPLHGNRGVSLAGFSAAFLLQQKSYGFNDCADFSSIDSEKCRDLAKRNPALFQLRIRQTLNHKRTTLHHAEAFCMLWDCVNGEPRKRVAIRSDARERAMKIIKSEWSDLYSICTLHKYL